MTLVVTTLSGIHVHDLQMKRHCCGLCARTCTAGLSLPTWSSSSAKAGSISVCTPVQVKPTPKHAPASTSASVDSRWSLIGGKPASKFHMWIACNDKVECEGEISTCGLTATCRCDVSHKRMHSRPAYLHLTSIG